MPKRSGGGYRASKNFEPSRGKSTKANRHSGRSRTQAETKDTRADSRGSYDRDGRGAVDHNVRGTAENTHRSNSDRAPRRASERAPHEGKSAAPEMTRNNPRSSGRGPKHVDGPKAPNTLGALPLPPLPPVPLAPLTPRITHPAETAGLTFEDLGLGGNIVRALGEQGVARPFAIQAVTIPDILAGHHVLGRGRTGSGKTIAFGAALVERLLMLKREGAFPTDGPKSKPQRGVRDDRERRLTRAPKALILAPTRELALQIDRTVQPIARSVGIYTGQFVGGAPFDPQLHALHRGVDIVIGTPGRIEDLIMRGHLTLTQVAVTVIDEADHMSELGFIEPVQRLLRGTRKRSQRLLFSATLDSRVEGLVAEFMPRPAVHEVVDAAANGGASNRAKGAGLAADSRGDVRHHVLVTKQDDKPQVLLQLAQEGKRTVVFTRTRAYADQLTEQFTEAGVKTIALHGNLSQIRRERNLEKFVEGKARVLVATDVAARGIHVDDVELVVQADAPADDKAYVHRAGRTGRVGRAGTVITVVPRNRQERMREVLAAAAITPDSFVEFGIGDDFPKAGRRS